MDSMLNEVENLSDVFYYKYFFIFSIKKTYD